MALITCPECGMQISDKAPSCPHCGVSVYELTKVACRFYRKSELKGKAIKFALTVDGMRLGIISPKSDVSVDLAPGIHTFELEPASIPTTFIDQFEIPNNAQAAEIQIGYTHTPMFSAYKHFGITDIAVQY